MKLSLALIQRVVHNTVFEMKLNTIQWPPSGLVAIDEYKFTCKS